MTWAEFTLRAHGYRRKERNDWNKIREVAYWSGAGTAFDASKLSIQDFMPIDSEELKHKSNKKFKISDKTKERFKELQRKYYLKKNDGKRK